jgi:hypothetical protein
VSTDGLVSILGGRGPLGVLNHVIDRRREIFHARARHDDRVPATVCLLGDTEEFAAIIFPELDVEVLALDLQLPGLYEVIHLFGKNGGVYAVRPPKGKQIFGANSHL